jgi:uncharacterized membrane protein
VSWDWTGAWAIGYYVGVAVVVLVVVLLVTMTALAHRIAEKAAHVENALRDAERATAVLWSVRETRTAAGRIVDGTRAARLAADRGGPGP